MDPGYLKIKIDIKSEHDNYKKKYDYKRKELKREEIKKIFESFKDFFKTDGNFKFKENEHSVTAEYKEHAIVLDMDIYGNIDSADFRIVGTIVTFENQTFEFIAEGVQSAEKALPPPGINDEERMVYDTKFYKEFLDGDVTYDFQYRITNHEAVYLSMIELLTAI